MASRKFRLKSNERPAEGTRRIAAGRADRAIEWLERAGETGDPGAVHTARKDLKKLRSLLRLVRGELEEGVYATENGTLRTAGRLLSDARDAEVKLETLEELIAGHDDELADEAIIEWRTELEVDRDAAVRALVHESSSVRQAISLIERTHDTVEHMRLDEDSWELFDAGLDRTYRRGRAAMGAARESGFAAPHTHEWRKRVKDLRYQLEVLRGAWPGVLEAVADEAHGLSDVLGDHHDMAVLAEDLAGRDMAGPYRERFIAAIVADQDELTERAVELGSRIYAEKPKAFLGRIHAYWLSWRPED